MLLTISTDRIIFINGEQRVILPYGDLEKSVSEFLYGPDFAAVKSQLLVLNGPGSFTNLRIVTLALNTYNMLHDFGIDFVSISKVDRYKNAFLNKEPGVKRYCVMYIGQKKNFWIVDLLGKHESINTEPDSSSDTNEGIVKIHVDQLREYVAALGDDWFVDEMVAEGKEVMDATFGDGGYAMYTFYDAMGTGKFEGEAVKMLEPNYMIAANVS